MERTNSAFACRDRRRPRMLLALGCLVALGASTQAIDAAASALPGVAGTLSPGVVSIGVDGTPGSETGTLLTRDALALSSERPVRRRRPSAHGYGYRPQQFATLGVGTFDPSDQPGSGFYMSGSVGSEISPQLDLGAQLSWYHRSTDSESFVSVRTDPAGNTVRQVIQTESVDTDLVPLMAVLRVRFPVSPGVQPYVGAGLGWEWLMVEGVDDLGFAFSDDYDGFGTQLLAGVNFRVGPQTAVYGEAVWNNSTVSAEFYDGFIGGTIREEIDVDGTGLHAGLRFRF